MKYEDKYFIFDDPQPTGVKSCLKNATTRAKTVIYKILMNLWHPTPGTEKKYYVAICAIFKNEAPYLKEWIEFHRIVGVDHFYLYNNFSEDNYQEVLQPYLDSGVVELIEWPYPQGQMSAYRDCVEKKAAECQWIGFFDLDEYVIPVQDNNIHDFLKIFEKNRGSVILYWKLYGTSGLASRNVSNLVAEDFTVCWRKHCNIGKCFYNTNYEFIPDLPGNEVFNHTMRTRYKGVVLPPVNVFDNVCVGTYNKADSADFPAQINHYFTKSYEEFLQKRKRGDAFFVVNPRDEAYFKHHEEKCAAVDYSAYKYLISLKQALNKM